MPGILHRCTGLPQDMECESQWSITMIHGSTWSMTSGPCELHISEWEKVKVKAPESCLTLCNYSPWNPPGQNTGVGSHSLLQQIFPTQELNQGLLRCRWILYQLSHQESPQKHRNSPWKRVWNPIMKPGKESSSSALGNCEKDLWANWLEDRRGMARNFVQQLNREWGTRRLLTNTGRKRGHR